MTKILNFAEYGKTEATLCGGVRLGADGGQSASGSRIQSPLFPSVGSGRLSGLSTLGCDAAENRAFISLVWRAVEDRCQCARSGGRQRRFDGLSADLVEGTSLYDYLGRCRHSGVYDDEAMEVLRSVMRDLAVIHSAPDGSIDYSVTVLGGGVLRGCGHVGSQPLQILFSESYQA